MSADQEPIHIGTPVAAHAHTFTATGVVIDHSGRNSIKVLLDAPHDALPGDALWFDRSEIDPSPPNSAA